MSEDGHQIYFKPGIDTFEYTYINAYKYIHSLICIHGYDNIEKLVDYLASLDRNVPTVEEMDFLIQGMLGTYLDLLTLGCLIKCA